MKNMEQLLLGIAVVFGFAATGWAEHIVNGQFDPLEWTVGGASDPTLMPNVTHEPGYNIDSPYEQLTDFYVQNYSSPFVAGYLMNDWFVQTADIKGLGDYNEFIVWDTGTNPNQYDIVLDVDSGSVLSVLLNGSSFPTTGFEGKYDFGSSPLHPTPHTMYEISTPFEIAAYKLKGKDWYDSGYKTAGIPEPSSGMMLLLALGGGMALFRKSYVFREVFR